MDRAARYFCAPSFESVSGGRTFTELRAAAAALPLGDEIRVVYLAALEGALEDDLGGEWEVAGALLTTLARARARASDMSTSTLAAPTAFLELSPSVRVPIAAAFLAPGQGIVGPLLNAVRALDASGALSTLLAALCRDPASFQDQLRSVENAWARAPFVPLSDREASRAADEYVQTVLRSLPDRLLGLDALWRVLLPPGLEIALAAQLEAYAAAGRGAHCLRRAELCARALGRTLDLASIQPSYTDSLPAAVASTPQALPLAEAKNKESEFDDLTSSSPPAQLLAVAPSAPSPEKISAARALVDELRTRFLGDDGAPLPAGLVQKVNDADEVLGQKLYEDPRRVLFELLQNADDCDYPAGQAPELHLSFSSTGIQLGYSETGFEAPHVRAICDVNRSTKSGDAQTTVRWTLLL